jgi:hypothetical protein
MSRLLQCGLLGQAEKETEGLVGDAVLRVVEIDARGLGRQPLAPPQVLGEQVPQVAVGDLVVVALQRLPGCALPQRG